MKLYVNEVKGKEFQEIKINHKLGEILFYEYYDVIADCPSYILKFCIGINFV